MRFYPGYIKHIRWLLLSACLFNPILVLAETLPVTETGKEPDVPAVEPATETAPETATSAEPETQTKTGDGEAAKTEVDAEAKTETETEAEIKAEPEPEDDTMTISGKRYQWIETSRRFVGNAVQKATGSVDSYLSSDQTVTENESYIRLRLGYVFGEGGSTYPNNDIKLKVDLSKTQHRWSLIFETNPDELQPLEQQQQDNTQQVQAFQGDNSSIGAVKFLMNDWRYWQNDFDVGIKTPLPLQPFVRFNMKRHYQITEYWAALLKNSVYYYSIEGFGEHSVLTLERPLSKRWTFYNTINMQWHGKDEILEYSDVVSFQHQLTDRDSFLYRTGIFYQEHPVPQVLSYFVDTIYRRRLHKDWLFGEIIPSTTWDDHNDFDSKETLTFRLEVIFN